MSKQLIALKLGSTTTTIFKQGEGLVLREPSLIAVSGYLKSREVKAVGKNAQKMLGRTSGSVSVVSPINAGVVTDTELASAMLKGFLKKIFPRTFLKPNIKAVLCVPLGISVEEKKAFEKTCYNAGIADVTLIPAIICSAIGDNIPVNTSTGKLIINIGGGCTNIAAMAMNQIITGVNISVGGTNINTAIEQYVLERYKIHIGPAVSGKVTKEIGSLLENNTANFEVQGINLETKESESVVIYSKDIYPIVVHYYSLVSDAISSVINSCPPDITTDIMREGIYVFGALSQISGLAKFLRDKLKVNVFISENGKTDIFGAAKLLDNPTEYHDIIRGL